MEICWRKMKVFSAECLYRIRVSSTFGQSDGCMSDTPETMGDFLVSLMAPLQETARESKLAGICYLNQGRCRLRHRLRGYVLFRVCHKGHTQKSYKLSPGCGHDPRSVPKLERHGSSKMQTFGWLGNSTFFEPNFICIST